MQQSGGERSLAETLASLPPEKEAEFLASYDEHQIKALLYDWEGFWARPKQCEPAGDWLTWKILAGRGYGKTRVGSEWIRKNACGKTPLAPGKVSRIALVAETAADGRDVMVQGESGILACHPKDFRPRYIKSSRSLQWPNGCIATLYNGTEPDQLRGPQHDCFIAGTMVTTDRGDVPIEQVVVGDFVQTRKGLRRVTHLRSRKAVTGTVSFSNGATLTGTGTHPICTSHGWVSMSDLQVGREVCAINASSGKVSYGTATAKVGDHITKEPTSQLSQNERSGFIELFGKNTSALFRPNMTSTTTMVTSPTTASATSNAYRTATTKGSTSQKIRSQSAIGAAKNLLRFSANAALRFIERKSQWKLFAKNASSAAPSETEKNRQSASFAAKRFKAEPVTFAINVASIWQPKAVAPVFCLTVEGQHEYFANGILVHNCAWVDEIAKFRYAQQAWDQLQFGLRLDPPGGGHAQQVVTTTPRPIPLVKAIIADPTTVTTRASTFDNAANLGAKFVEQIRRKYEGTRLGRQELYAEILDDIQGALWTRENLDENRYSGTLGNNQGLPVAKPLRRKVLAIDPPTTSGEDSDECGIVVCGLEAAKVDGNTHFQVLEDASVQGFTPKQWAAHALTVAKYHNVDCIVAETNQGGEMIQTILNSLESPFRYKGVHAKDGKVIRAEPVSALYEQNRVHHVGDPSSPLKPSHTKMPGGEGFNDRATLEDQMCSFTIDFDPQTSGYSPDRVDALVHCITELHGGFTAPTPSAPILVS